MKAPVVRFEFWSGDVDPLTYGGVWCYRVSPARFHFIRLENWVDLCGRDAPGETYCVDLHEVDIDAVSRQQTSEALSCLGIWDDEPFTLGRIAEALRSYGLAAPLFSESGNNWRKLFIAAAARSKEVAADATLLDKGAVNKIGSTPREFMRGDLASPLARGLAAGDRDAALVACIFRGANYNTLGGVAEDIRAVVEKKEMP